MKFILVIIICIGANCNAVWEQSYYPTYESCVQVSQTVRQYMMNAYPESAGEIHCLTEDEFNEFYDYLENGGQPSIGNNLQNPSST